MKIREIERTYLVNGNIKVTVERKRLPRFNISVHDQQYRLDIDGIIKEYAKRFFNQDAELTATEEVYYVRTHDEDGACYWLGEYRRVYPSYLPTPHYYIVGKVERVICCNECLDSSVHLLTDNEIEDFFKGEYEYTIKKFSCGDKVTIEVELEQNHNIEKSQVIIKEGDKIIKEFDSILELIAYMFSDIPSPTT